METSSEDRSGKKRYSYSRSGKEWTIRNKSGKERSSYKGQVGLYREVK